MIYNDSQGKLVAKLTNKTKPHGYEFRVLYGNWLHFWAVIIVSWIAPISSSVSETLAVFGFLFFLFSFFGYFIWYSKPKEYNIFDLRVNKFATLIMTATPIVFVLIYLFGLREIIFQF